MTVVFGILAVLSGSLTSLMIYLVWHHRSKIHGWDWIITIVKIGVGVSLTTLMIVAAYFCLTGR